MKRSVTEKERNKIPEDPYNEPFPKKQPHNCTEENDNNMSSMGFTKT